MLPLAYFLLACSSVAPASGSASIARLAPDAPERSQAPPPAITQEELVRMSKAGMKDEAIIGRIRETGSRYALTASQAITLHDQGVNGAVLDYILSAREQELLDRSSEAINLCEKKSAEALSAERERARSAPYCDPFWQPYPGFGWMGGGMLRPHGGVYRRW